MSADDMEIERILRLAAGMRKFQTTRTDEPKRELESHPTPEEIRMHAYQIYLSRGAVHGLDGEDWLQAERELMATSSEQRGGPSPLNEG